MFRFPEKGSFGYFNQKKKLQLIFSILSLLAVIIIYVTGWILYDTNKSIYSVIAAVAVLPFAKILVAYLMVAPYQSLDKDKAEKLNRLLEGKPQTDILYDILLASEQKRLLAGTIIIIQGNVLVFSEHKSVKLEETEQYLRKILEGCRISSIKMYTDFSVYQNKINDFLKSVSKETKTPQDLEKMLLQMERIRKNILIYTI